MKAQELNAGDVILWNGRKSIVESVSKSFMGDVKIKLDNKLAFVRLDQNAEVLMVGTYTGQIIDVE